MLAVGAPVPDVAINSAAAARMASRFSSLKGRAIVQDHMSEYILNYMDGIRQSQEL
jgi:hypothetical protein